MPAPSAGAARREEISSCWGVLHATMLRLGDLVVLVGDLNAEPAGAGARRTKPALHRALGDGLLQGMMKDLNLKWLGSQRPTFFQAVDRVEGGDTTKAFPHRDATAGHRRTPPSTLFNGNLFSLDITCVCGSLLYDCWFFCLRRENLLQDTQPITNTTRGSLPFRFAKEVSSLLVSFIPLAFASRCGNDVVVSSEWKAKRASKWGATAHTPLFFFSPFLFF
jgi:hypothetical protein